MARTNREVPQNVRDKISAALMGRKVSDETREKMSASQRAAWARVPKKQEAASIWGSDNNDLKDQDNGKTN